MPWAGFSNWTEKDRHAVVVYLRHLRAVWHQVPEPTAAPSVTIRGAIEQAYGGKGYGSPKRDGAVRP